MEIRRVPSTVHYCAPLSCNGEDQIRWGFCRLTRCCNCKAVCLRKCEYNYFPNLMLGIRGDFISQSASGVHFLYIAIFCFIARYGMETLPQDHCQTFRHDLHVLLLRHLPRPHGHGVPTCNRKSCLLTILGEQVVQQPLLWFDGGGFG